MLDIDIKMFRLDIRKISLVHRSLILRVTETEMRRNAKTKLTTSPWASNAEQLLAAAANKIDLPPSALRALIERRNALEKYLERDGSPLKGRIRLFYPQGSVAIGATIKSRYREEGFDIDVMVERIGQGLDPCDTLDELYEAVRGEPGSRYYKMTERQTRCITVKYKENGIHVDLTPSELVDQQDPRHSVIFHAKPEEARNYDRRVPTNSYAFVKGYNEKFPVDTEFEVEYSRWSADDEREVRRVLNEAASQPALPHSEVLGGKSAVTVALQLLKRFRNVRWENRGGRMPPSVMLSCLAYEAAVPGRSISENLIVITGHILDRLISASQNGHLIQVRNPFCPADDFTDRWPENHADQKLMIEEMNKFSRLLAELLNEGTSIERCREILQYMFGESVGDAAIEAMGRNLAASAGIGGAAVGATSAAASPSFANTMPSSKPATFYGRRILR